MSKAQQPEPGQESKQVSTVELYLDLVFVLAVGELAHLIVDTPTPHTVWVTLGLFIVLWWTWIGFTGSTTAMERTRSMSGCFS